MPTVVKPANKQKKTKKAKTKETPAAPPLDYASHVLEGLLEDCGQDSAQLLGSDGLAIKIRGVISTQSATIDAATGRGGIPRSRLTIIHGPEASGKTTLALHLVAETQRLGGVAVYVDKEYKLDPEYASAVGVDTSKLILSQPPYLEKAFEFFDKVIDRARDMRLKGIKAPILIILDSMNAAIGKAQFEGGWDQNHMAVNARVYSQCLPKLIPRIHTEDIALVWISQVRKKMNVQFGDDNDIAGGQAPRFYASMIMNVKRIGKIGNDGEKTGSKTLVECKKNQIAPPFKKAECEIIWGEGFNQTGSLLDQAVRDGFVKQKGAFYRYKDNVIGQGRDAAIKNISPELAARLIKKIEFKRGWER